MSQQARKEQEGAVVRRLTAGAGAAALGLAWYFTASAMTAVPVAFGAQPAPDAGQPVVGIEQLDDDVFVRTVHVPAMRAPAGGVRSGTTQQASSGGQAATATRTSSGAPASTTSSAAAAQPIAQPMSAAATPPPAPAPTPVATTGGSTPAK